MEAEVRSKRKTSRKRNLDYVEEPRRQHRTAGLPKKRRAGPRGWPTKFQGKWESTLGTLFVIGNEGFYGDDLQIPLQAKKFLKNITASNDKRNIRGNWRWDRDDETFGRFDIELSEDFKTFEGTWGWRRRICGGGFWRGHRGKSFNLNIEADAPKTVPLIVTPTGQTPGSKSPTFGTLHLRPSQTIDPAMLIYQRQMNAYAIASYPNTQLNADKSQKDGIKQKSESWKDGIKEESDKVKQPEKEKFTKAAVPSVQEDLPTKELETSNSEPEEEEECEKKEANAEEVNKNKEAAAAAASQSTGLVMSPLYLIYSQ